MIKRRAELLVEEALSRQAAVALIGPRQVGKTTLALEIARKRESLYLDLESLEDRAKLVEPALFLREFEDKLVILDEIHRAPEIFQTLRVLIDEGRRKGKRFGRFLVLGSASIDLLRQSGESLAGRIEYVDMGPFNVLEVNNNGRLNDLWIRGGFPESYLAASDVDSFKLRRSFIRTYLERDVLQFGPRLAAETLERLWIMLAHNQASILNASRIAAALSVSSPTVTSYIDLLTDLLLVRRLPPFTANVGKRISRSPKVFIRDSGLLHALLGITDFNDLHGHPIVGASWEGFVIENILSVMPDFTTASYYRTSGGAEIDLLLQMPGKRGTWAIEIKRGLTARPTRGFHSSLEDIKPDKSYVVYAGDQRYPLGQNSEAIGLPELAREIALC
ncbi:MAG TPA: ATP-binding protein [Planktothrix sp.]|jgi:hypothetical protein